MGVELRQIFSTEIVQALDGANSPSIANVFATMTDVNAVSVDVTTLKNNEYKITYYEVVSGASGTLTLPAQATINADEFGLAGNCVLSKIDGSNKPTFQSPTTAGGTIVTATLNTLTGAWTTSGVYTDAFVALIYSVEIKGIYLSNLTYNNIIETIAVNPVLVSGEFGVTLTTTGTTNITLPTTGTLVTTAVTSLPSLVGVGTLTSGATGAGFTVALSTSTITGTLGITNGGTGQTTANNAFNALAPSQATFGGLFLTTDGTNTSWAAAGSGSVTTVSVVTNQGVSGSVANASTTPAITLTLGALTGVTSLNGLVVTANTGVITTGTWNGTLISPTYGGTGVNNGSNTLTLAGNLATTGAFNTTFAQQASVITTLPPVATTLVGKTGTSAQYQIPYYNDADQITTSTGLKTDASHNINYGSYLYPGAQTTDYIFYSGGAYYMRAASNFVWRINSNNSTMTMGLGWLDLSTVAQTTGAVPTFKVKPGLNTGSTASTDNNAVFFDFSSTQTHNTGAITQNNDFLIKARPHAFVAASTISDAFTQYINGAPTAGTNATITRAWGLGIVGNVQHTGSTYLGGATTAPTALLHLAAGTASAGTAPLKFTAGTLTTVAEALTIEPDGTNFYITPNTTVGRFPIAANSVQYTTPVTSATVTATQQVSQLVCNPAGTLAALTITFPPNPVNGQVFGIAISQIITAITLQSGTGAATINGTILTTGTNSAANFVYCSTPNAWFQSQ